MAFAGFVKWSGLTLSALVLSGCVAATGPRDGFAETDYYEPTSRVMHDVNVGLDENVLSPVARVYEFVTPALFQHMIGNGLSHLDLPNDFVNYVLQGDVDRSVETFGRFVVNTLVGAGGLLDPATEFGLPKQDTDFGTTLGKSGVDEGTYFVLPVLGPTTTRDTAGFFLDRLTSPTLLLGAFTSLPLDGASIAITTTELVDGRTRNRDFIDEVLYRSEDSYVTLRAGYLQRRRAQIAGDNDLESLPDLFEED